MMSITHTVRMCLLLFTLQIRVHASELNSLSQFSSHVTVHTPARSYSHGVGDPISTIRRRVNHNYQRPQSRGTRRLRIHPSAHQVHNGYPKLKPVVPFYGEEITNENSLNVPWHNNNFYESAIPILPPSPYKVDSPDPESLWPEGLFLPPITPHRFGNIGRRIGGNAGQVLTEKEPFDPYLLEGSEAVAAVTRANENGELFFHLIPHIESLLSNQELRIKNQLKPHRIASIRHTWPYNRP